MKSEKNDGRRETATAPTGRATRAPAPETATKAPPETRRAYPGTYEGVRVVRPWGEGPVGTVLQVHPDRAKRLIKSRFAEGVRHA